MVDLKSHWEEVYQNKKFEETSWFQKTPRQSFELIQSLPIQLEDPIIDVGAGDALLISHLLKKGYNNLSALDISKGAIDRAKDKLGNKASKVQWMLHDVSAPLINSKKYQLWHDRAAFHFLNSDEAANQYKQNCLDAIELEGFLIIGTFSKNGPTKCSGIEIRQYDAEDLEHFFKPEFKLISSHKEMHETPFNTHQEFTFCVFQRNS